MFTKLQWGQRYSNHPGNVAWCALFLAFGWTDKFHLSMQILGIVNAFITFSSLFVNLIACGGTSTTVKKIIIIQWIIGLLLMLGCEGYAIYLYLISRN